MELSGHAKMYLEWLGENEPQYLKHLLQTHQLNKLKRKIDRKVAQAALVIDQQMKGGKSYREAEEIAIYEILARTDGRAYMENPPPEPLSGEEMEEIYRKLDHRDRAKLRVVKPLR